MENIIKKAIEGGWNAMRPEKEAAITFRMFTETEYGNGAVFIETSFIENGEDNGRSLCIRSEEVFCDPLFWQALGKACGWGEMPSGDIWQGKARWYYSAMQFHEINLTQGFESAVEWLENIIN